jgi:hypothetical protein
MSQPLALTDSELDVVNGGRRYRITPRGRLYDVQRLTFESSNWRSNYVGSGTSLGRAQANFEQLQTSAGGQH